MSRPYVITVSSEKGGVGKTTLATNLAIYLKATAEDLTVTLLSFDNHFSVDKMFRIGRNSGNGQGSVAEIFNGSQLDELTQTGEYGIQFVPSAPDMAAVRDHVQGHEALARALAESHIEGIVIIDTRPDLDIFTRNALFAADRVIVPVKDTPSLENCRHIFAFFEHHDLPRHTLQVLPCLIDQRIRFAGPFKSPYHLMRAYAINRGYNCYDGYISKSPKVESLNTNPEGRIYPVLTHGNHTEVHTQFTDLAQTVYRDFLKKENVRSDKVRLDLRQRRQRRKNDYEERRQLLASECLVCGGKLLDERPVSNDIAYYAETSDGRITGYIEEECFAGLVFRYIFNAGEAPNTVSPLQQLLRESAQRCYFVLQRAPNTRGFYEQRLSFYRFDENLLELSHKQVPLSRDENSALHRLAARTLFDEKNLLSDHFLLIRRISSDFPEEILYDEQYREYLAAGSRIARQLPD